MYVFPHPVQIDPSGRGQCRLIVPAAWNLSDGRLKRVATIPRTIVDPENWTTS
jgi:hypothetical protein